MRSIYTHAIEAQCKKNLSKISLENYNLQAREVIFLKSISINHFIMVVYFGWIAKIFSAILYLGIRCIIYKKKCRMHFIMWEIHVLCFVGCTTNKFSLSWFIAFWFMHFLERVINIFNRNCPILINFFLRRILLKNKTTSLLFELVHNFSHI